MARIANGDCQGHNILNWNWFLILLMNLGQFTQAFLLCLFSHTDCFPASTEQIVKLYDAFNSHANAIFHVGFHLLQTINLLLPKWRNIWQTFQLKVEIFWCMYTCGYESRRKIDDGIYARTFKRWFCAHILSIKTLVKLMKCLQISGYELCKV